MNSYNDQKNDMLYNDDHAQESSLAKIALSQDPAKNDLLILVDSKDEQTGVATKSEAHIKGLLHRAFSVVLIRSESKEPEILLSRRAEGKYHSAGLWANSCCSHPRSGEDTLDAALRRVKEELGCEVSDLTDIGAFIYKAEFDNGLTEHEYDHVLIGGFKGALSPDPSEVSETKWIRISALEKQLKDSPEIFSAWAEPVLTMSIKYLSHK